MRSERTATCTSGDPVSPDLVAYVLMTSALRAGVIDIGFPFSLGTVVLTVGGRAGMSSSAVTTLVCYAQASPRATATYRNTPWGSRAASGNHNENQPNFFSVHGPKGARAPLPKFVIPRGTH